jgi:hypothetical protein
MQLERHEIGLIAFRSPPTSQIVFAGGQKHGLRGYPAAILALRGPRAVLSR